MIIRGVGTVTIQAAGGDLKRFEMVAYTGGKLRVPMYALPIVIDLAGLDIPSQQRPVLRDHKPFKVVGHTDSVQVVDGKTVLATGVISGTGPDAREVLATASNGFQWACSIGALPDEGALQLLRPGETAEANGQTFIGPLYIARRSALKEISFVPIGADAAATAYVAASGGTDMTFEQWALGFMTMEEFQALTEDAKAVLQKVYDSLQAGTDTTDSTDSTSTDTTTPPTDPTAMATASANPPAAAASGATGVQAVSVPSIQAMQPIITAAVAQALALQQVRNRNPQPASNGPHIHVSRGRVAPTPAIIEAALCMTLNVPKLESHYKEQDLEAASKQFRNISLQQVMIMAAAANGYQPGPGERIHSGNLRPVMRAAFSGAPMIQAGWTPLSLSGILSNVANKELLTGYMEGDQTWREVAAVKSVTDFKSMTSYRMLDDLQYEEVGPGGEIKHGKLGEESYTRQAKTYAKMLTLTRQDIINDDLGAFDDLRNRLGRGAIQKFNNVFWTEFMSDASTFWTSIRGNYITGATTTLLTDGVGLGLGLKAFRQMKSPSDKDGGKRIGGNPSILLVPPELEGAADKLYQGGNLNVGSSGGGDVNIYQGKYKPVVSAWLSDSNFTGYSTTAWYLLRSPAEMPAIVVSFLNGQQTPTVEDAEADFNVLGVQFRGYHDFGCDQAEYLAGVKSKGAT